MKLFMLGIFSCLNLFLGAQNILINEIMSNNETTVPDVDGDFSDWIELYNPDTVSVDLTGYHLSDDFGNPGKWTFPTVSIPAHGRILIFASNKNLFLHTNFKISSQGEPILLTDPAGALIDQLPPVALECDQAYGRLEDGHVLHNELFSPSPNADNENSQIVFSHSPGFYNSAFLLDLDTPFPDSIYYTTDGSQPDTSSNLYFQAIDINARDTVANYFSEFTSSAPDSAISFQEWISPSQILDKSNVIRCQAFRNGQPVSQVYTQTFFVDAVAYSLPVISLATSEENLFDYYQGIYVPGVYFNNQSPGLTGNFFRRGSLWERPIHIEFFDQSGELKLSQNAGVRIHGGRSRQAAQKSLRFYARSEYGDCHFDHQLLPQKSKDEYKRFILRSSMGEWRRVLFQGALAYELVRGLDFETPDFQPTIVFLNGEFWGIQTIFDRLDEQHLAEKYSLEADSIVIRTWPDPPLDNYISQNDLSIDSNYQYVLQNIDIDSYIDYQIAEIFLANYDWPGNNQRVWKQGPNSGKWRWIFYDLDAAFGDPEGDMFEHVIRNDSNVNWPNPPWSTFFFRNMILNDTFVDHFTDRFAEVLNHEFQLREMTRKYHQIKNLYAPEIPGNIIRWHHPSTVQDWESHSIDSILSFLEERPCNIEEQITDFFNLSQFDFDCQATGRQSRVDFDDISLHLYPNPASQQFNLVSEIEETQTMEMSILDIRGRKVFHQSNFQLRQGEATEVNLGELANGFYLVTLVNEKYNFRKKLQVLK